MKCDCGQPIPEIRLELGYTCCVNCSTEKKAVCFMVFSHKTAPELISVNGNKPEQIRQAHRANARSR